MLTRAAARRARAAATTQQEATIQPPLPPGPVPVVAGHIDMSRAGIHAEMRDICINQDMQLPLGQWVVITCTASLAVYGHNAIVTISNTEALSTILVTALACRVTTHNSRDDRTYTLVFAEMTDFARMFACLMPFLHSLPACREAWMSISVAMDLHILYCLHDTIAIARAHSVYIAHAFLAAFNADVTARPQWYGPDAPSVAQHIIALKLHRNPYICAVFCNEQERTAFLCNPLAQTHFALVVAAITQ